MADGALHFTKREWRRQIRSPLLWLSLAATALVIGIAGPFSTYENVGLPLRLAYWAVVVVASYFICIATITLLEQVFPTRGAVWPYAVFGLVGGAPIALFVLGLNRAVFGGWEVDPLALLLSTSAIAGLGSGVIAAFTRALRPAEPAAGEPAGGRPPLIDRLPAEMRGALSHLTVQDHYVEVHTDKGRHLLLMRLSDAMLETGGVAGLQIHRSHWVASAAVARAERRNGRLHLVLRDGTALPVSRNHQAAVRDAGLA